VSKNAGRYLVVGSSLEALRSNIYHQVQPLIEVGLDVEVQEAQYGYVTREYYAWVYANRPPQPTEFNAGVVKPGDREHG
jgi:hypothetical protein